MSIIAPEKETKYPYNAAGAPWPYYAEDEVQAVADVLRSGKVNYWTGQEGREFEREFAAFAGTRHAIALANGTLALELALIGGGIGAGDDVIVTPRTFMASASSIVVCGARPVFADVDRDSGNITAETIAAALTPRTKAIIVVHIGGWPCDMEPIMALAEERDLFVIEDCAQAHGALYRGRSIGSFGHVNAWSFCQDKIVTTGGEGGMVTTNDAERWSAMWSYKDHGKSYDAVYNRQHPPGFRWVHESIGTNWRLTEPQSAIGRIQMRKLPQWVEARRANAKVLVDRLSSHPALRVPVPDETIYAAYYRFYAYLRPETLKPDWTRDRIVTEINGYGVPCFSGSCSEVYREKALQDRGLAPQERLPVARELGETALAFLTHPTLTEADMQVVADVVERVLASATQDR